VLVAIDRDDVAPALAPFPLGALGIVEAAQPVFRIDRIVLALAGGGLVDLVRLVSGSAERIDAGGLVIGIGGR
jgi:hypothetical protein